MATFAALPAALMLGGGALDVIGKLTGAKEEQEMADAQKREAARKAGVAQQLGIEKQRGIERAKQRAVGRVAGAAAKGGVRQSGSVRTLSQRVGEEYELEKKTAGIQTTEAVRGYEMEAWAAGKRGKAAKRKGFWGAGESLLGTASNVFGYGSGMGWF